MEAAHSGLLSVESEKSLPFMTGPSSAARTSLVALLVFVMSFLVDMLGDTTVFTRHGISVIWPTNGLLVAVILLMPRRIWPVLLAAGIAAQVAHDLFFGFTPRATGLFALGDTIQILIIVLGLGYSFDGLPRLNSLKALGKYCFFAAFLAPAVGAFIGANGISGSYAVNWRVWFFGEMLGFLTFTPAILSWFSARRDWIHRSPHSTAEAAALLITLAIFGYLALLAPWKTLSSTLTYCFVPFLLWAALRFGSLGVSASMIVISFLSLWGALHGHGPFTEPEPFLNVLSLQLFLIFAAAPFMTLAAVVEDRERARLVEKELSRRLISAQEQERIRIARELHDDVAQQLALLAMELAQTKRSLHGLPQVSERLEEIRQHSSDVALNVQMLSHKLHNAKLDYLGLVAATRTFCKEVAQQYDVGIDFKDENIPKNLAKDVSLCLFRVAQESLHNAVKYSGTKEFAVELSATTNEVQLVVSDAGAGFDVENATTDRGLGLVSMKERVQLIHGRFHIESKPGAGTRIVASAPLVAELGESSVGLWGHLFGRSPGVA